MFTGQKKRYEKLIQYLDEAFSGQRRDMDGLEKRLEEQLEDKIASRLEERLAESREENSKLLRRQSGSLEDILEELQCQSAAREEEKALRDREKELVELCCLLAGQKEMILKQLLAKGLLPEEVREGWKRQAELMEQETAGLERKCTFQRIGACGEKVDYDCHEILAVHPAAREKQGGTVAEVFSEGYVYRGHVIKKAQVAAYRYEQEAESSSQMG